MLVLIIEVFLPCSPDALAVEHLPQPPEPVDVLVAARLALGDQLEHAVHHRVTVPGTSSQMVKIRRSFHSLHATPSKKNCEKNPTELMLRK